MARHSQCTPCHKAATRNGFGSPVQIGLVDYTDDQGDGMETCAYQLLVSEDIFEWLLLSNRIKCFLYHHERASTGTRHIFYLMENTLLLTLTIHSITMAGNVV